MKVGSWNFATLGLDFATYQSLSKKSHPVPRTGLILLQLLHLAELHGASGILPHMLQTLPRE